MDLLFSILRFLWIMFLVLMVFNLMIVVHEWGHFLAARWRGLKIERFQIWFGKPLWKKTINGVQYGLGSIPFGGFVALPQMAPMEAMEGKNLTEEEDREVLPPIKPLDKIIVAFAGPLFSFLLAVLFAAIVALPWVGRVVKESDATAEVGYVWEGSAAERAGIKPGDRILAMDGHPIKRFHGMLDSVDWYTISSNADKIEVEIQRPGEAVPRKVTLDMAAEAAETEKLRAEAEEKRGLWAKVWAFVFERPPLPHSGMIGRHSPKVGKVTPHSPAADSGLKETDVIATMDGKPVLSIPQVTDYIKEKGTEAIRFGILSGEEAEARAMNPESAPTPKELVIAPRVPDVWTLRTSDGKEIPKAPVIGISWDDHGVSQVKTAAEYPEARVGPQIKDSLRSIYNILGAMFQPKSNVKPTHLSSAVGIMNLYYRLFEHPDGWRLVLWFSVILNVNLAILNLLPLPVLDGGHIVMAIIEAIRRRPLTGKPVEWIQSGFALALFSLMIILVLKDIGDFGGKVSGKAEFLPPDKRAQASPAGAAATANP